MFIFQVFEILFFICHKQEWKVHQVFNLKRKTRLVEALKELCNSGYKCDNDTFKSGYTIILEKAMTISCPRSNIKVAPHIESKIKT